MYNVPVLVVAYNRPWHLSKVSKAVMNYYDGPVLYALDGPKNEEDKAKTDAVRSVVRGKRNEKVEVIESRVNLGSKQRVYSAISEVLSHYESVIILEDDCVPTPEFFRYCNSLLKKYSKSESVYCISGRNDLGTWRVDDTHFFVPEQMQGWATWRDKWLGFDVNMKTTKETDAKVMEYYSLYPNIGKLVVDATKEAIENKIDAWDHQWTYYMAQKFGVTAVASYNMIKNIGYGDGATHTKNWKASMNYIKVYDKRMKYDKDTAIEVDWTYVHEKYKRRRNWQPIQYITRPIQQISREISKGFFNMKYISNG